MATPKTRIVVADASKARYFDLDPTDRSLTELDADINPEGRMHRGDLTRDDRGEHQSSDGMAQGTMEPSTDPEDVQLERFSKAIVKRLEAARTGGEIETVWLAAPPRLLGRLREDMKPPLRSVISKEIDKDLTSLSPDELYGRMADRLT
ncbi:host attachment protein [Marinobacter lipolyticus]|uniref:host attachment protein n=1 Tax=Marinobacter lipolyticus TaxID=209639 RepID=UPI001BCF4577|nr:host attachment protein [Marinobacter lipolyticus]MBS8241537.1 host attachment protein [Marinobacter lipolyticus]